MDDKEPTLKDLGQAIAETTELLRGFIGYAEGRFEKIDLRFDALDQELKDFKQETANNFRQVNRELADLGDNSIPLGEQSEIRLRVHRIEEHIGLPHEVKPA